MKFLHIYPLFKYFSLFPCNLQNVIVYQEMNNTSDMATPTPYAPHWALDHREVILEWWIWKIEKMPSKSLCLMVKNIHDSQWTVSNSFGPYLRDLLSKIWQIYRKCSNSVNFWARKMFLFVFKNGSEFCQKLIGTIFMVLVRHLHAESGITHW